MTSKPCCLALCKQACCPTQYLKDDKEPASVLYKTMLRTQHQRQSGTDVSTSAQFLVTASQTRMIAAAATCNDPAGTIRPLPIGSQDAGQGLRPTKTQLRQLGLNPCAK
jgi:hypothetical protein